MPNITFDNYKEAILAKFEIEREGAYSHYLRSPSQANLRNLCWEKFNLNTNASDLGVFSSFFEFEFDPVRFNHFRDYTDRFRPVGGFLRGDTEPNSRFTVELAAILVDFEQRPFQKFFNERNGGIGSNTGDEDPEEPSSPVDGEITETKEPGKVPEEKKTNTDIHLPPDTDEPVKQTATFLEKIKSFFTRRFARKIKNTTLGVIVVFALTGGVVYFAFFKKHCMQWSVDHYEIVDCTQEKTANLNPIIPIDDRLLDFKKIVVCDTTNCYAPDGQAVIWYSKNNGGADFFNSNGIGRHPETQKALRPITNYIQGKYKTPCNLVFK